MSRSAMCGTLEVTSGGKRPSARLAKCGEWGRVSKHLGGRSCAPRRAVSLLLAAALVALGVVGVAAATTAQAAGTPATLRFVAAASTVGNRTSHTVTIPATVKAGDSLVLFLTTNSTTSTLTGAVAGWSLIQSKDGSGTRGRAWSRTATAADAGRNVTVTTGALAKSVLSVSAYRSSAGASKVTASAGAKVDTATTSHRSPSVAVADSGSWLVNVWSEKSSVASVWTAPRGSTVRTGAAGTGTGKISAILADSSGVVATGTAPGRTATTNVSVSRSVLFSVVVSPGIFSGNRAPVASFTHTCATVVCAFDASASTDAEGEPLTYSWDFGDGTSGTGTSPTHTYPSAGARTVTLTVGDGTLTGLTTRQVTPTAVLPGPGYTRLAPDVPRTDTPKIGTGQIWDLEVVGDRVFIAGTFTSIANTTATNNTSYEQPGLASYNLDTGLVDASFRPAVGGGDVTSVEASPDGTRLYIAGSFSTVNGVTRRGVARLDPTTGAPMTGFTANTDAKATELAVSSSTVYVGGKFAKVNGVARSALAAVDATTGTVDSGFVNNITGGIGVNGELTVQRLELSHDQSRLLVVHTGRQVNGQDRYGVALVNTLDKKLLPWRTRLWDDNLQFVGGIQRVYGADIAPDDTYFVVTSGSGGDRPPINDTVIAFPIDGADHVEPKWVTRCFDSVYSVAISEKAVYVGGHFAWNESPTAPDPWPGLDDVGYGTGQGLSGYGLGDAVVRRDHIGALNPVDGHALEWNPGSNSYEGNKAMEVTPRGLFTGGDATTQGGYNVGRVAFYDFGSEAAGNGVDTTITDPIEGRVKPAGIQFKLQGGASASTGGVQRVQIEVLDRATKRYLQDDLTSWGSGNTINTTLDSPSAASTGWSLPLTVTGNHNLQVLARAFSTSGTSDPTKATKKFETFGLADQPPNTTVSGPTGSVVSTTTFTVTGTATDDVGVNSVSMTLRDGDNRYLQDDGSVSTTYHTFRVAPDVVGATNTTWSEELTVPYEGQWKVQAKATDTAGQADLDTGDRSWVVSSTGIAPSVSISAPATMVPPTLAQPLVVAPGSPLTFQGSANDDESLNSVEIQLQNTTTRERLASDGTWGTSAIAGWFRISPTNLTAPSYSWAYTTPFDLKAGTYLFTVRATDDLGLSTSTVDRGTLTVNAQVRGTPPRRAFPTSPAPCWAGSPCPPTGPAPPQTTSASRRSRWRCSRRTPAGTSSPTVASPPRTPPRGPPWRTSARRVRRGSCR